MFRLVRSSTVQRVVRQYNSLTKQPLSNANKTSVARITLSYKRQASTKTATSDGMLYIIGAGFLAASSAVAYKTVNIGYKPDKAEEVATPVVEETPNVVEEREEPEEEPEQIEETPSVEVEIQPVENNEGTDQAVVTEEREDKAVEAELAIMESEAVLTDPQQPTGQQDMSEEKQVDSIVETDANTQLAVNESTEMSISIPSGAQYVIIGAGTAAHAASRAIRKNDPTGKILVIGEEDVLPYMRPPLSKELWFTGKEDTAQTLLFNAWDGKERSVFFEKSDYYTDVSELPEKAEGGTSVLTGKKVTSIDADDHSVTLASGETVKYDKLLIATGGTPKKHPAFDLKDQNVTKKVTFFRNVSDFRRLDEALKGSETVAIVGGGFLGSELACALAAKGKKNNLKVSQIYGENGNMAKVLPDYLSEWTTKKVGKEGVNTIPHRSVVGSQLEGEKVSVVLDNGEKVQADHVIVCVGIEPNVELASAGGLEVDPIQGGFRVNSELEARSDIWVAGDAACFYDMTLGRRRVEHHDHAVVSGRLAGENMTGAKKAYKHQSMFWSDLGPEVGYEAIGLVDSTLPTVGIWAKATSEDTPKAAAEKTGEGIRSEVAEDSQESTPENVEAEVAQTSPQTSPPVTQDEQYGKGVVFYMTEKKIVGVLLWNVFGQMPVARRIIAEQKDHDDLNETAKLFKIFS